VATQTQACPHLFSVMATNHRAAQMARHKVGMVKVVNALTRNAKIETHGIIFQMKIHTKYE
jgi:hypothetical protein